eukprot:1455625-Pyramimonas_sp.AAC.1
MFSLIRAAWVGPRGFQDGRREFRDSPTRAVSGHVLEAWIPNRDPEASETSHDTLRDSPGAPSIFQRSSE